MSSIRTMKDINIPIPDITENETAEVEVNIKGRKLRYNFRVVSFPWEKEDKLTETKDHLSLSLARIYRLKKSIESYDNDWELIQIYKPSKNADHIHIWYREKKH
jgi:hypothetical protein